MAGSDCWRVGEMTRSMSVALASHMATWLLARGARFGRSRSPIRYLDASSERPARNLWFERVLVRKSVNRWTKIWTVHEAYFSDNHLWLRCCRCTIYSFFQPILTNYYSSAMKYENSSTFLCWIGICETSLDSITWEMYEWRSKFNSLIFFIRSKLIFLLLCSLNCKLNVIHFEYRVINLKLQSMNIELDVFYLKLLTSNSMLKPYILSIVKKYIK